MCGPQTRRGLVARAGCFEVGGLRFPLQAHAHLPRKRPSLVIAVGLSRHRGAIDR